MISVLDIDIIDTHNFKTLGILDTSVYNPDIDIADTRIEILPPGFKLFAKPHFVEKALNVFNSNNVGITRASCQEDLIDLPDGLWTIRYSICPNDKTLIEKVFIRVDKLLCKFNQAFLTLDLSTCNNDVDKYKMNFLEKIDLFIQGSIAATNNKNFKLANDLYKKASNLLDEYNKLGGNCTC